MGGGGEIRIHHELSQGRLRHTNEVGGRKEKKTRRKASGIVTIDLFVLFDGRLDTGLA